MCFALYELPEYNTFFSERNWLIKGNCSGDMNIYDTRPYIPMIYFDFV